MQVCCSLLTKHRVRSWYTVISQGALKVSGVCVGTDVKVMAIIVKAGRHAEQSTSQLSPPIVPTNPEAHVHCACMAACSSL